MINSKSSFIARRTTRRRFAHCIRRCIGLERLERRTVFASDFGANLESHLLACSVDEMQPEALVEPVSTPASQVRSESVYQPSPRNSSFEIASSPISLENGDLLVIEVPSASFADMPIYDSYLFTYSYAQNYFSDTIGQELAAINFQALAQASGAWFTNAKSAVDGFVGAGSLPLGTESETLENQLQPSDRTIVLASLTATTDFDATIRVFDNSQVDSLVGSRQSDFGIRQLPNEIRIEPNLTSATVLPDPGPTITRTIIVNRQSEGLVIEEQPTKQFGPLKPEPTERQVSDSSLNANSDLTSAPASSQTSVTKPSRPSVTIKTIDISQVRRQDTARPWLRSTVVQTPARQRDFGFEKKPTIVTASATTPPLSQPTSASKSEKSARWNSRVSATRLQPVEFLLASRDLETEKVAVLEEKPPIATDVAMSSYSDVSRIDCLENEFFLDWLSAIGLGIQAGSLSSEESSGQSPSARHGSEAWFLAMTTEMQRLAQYPPANANRDTWKSLVRSASESAAGQAILATLLTISMQQKEMTAFDSKSAWEYVTKAHQSSQT